MITWSDHDEQPVPARLLAVAVVSGVVLRLLPKRLDVFHVIIHRVGLMTPTCGMTRAGLALVRLDLGTAWTYNPGIFPVAALAVLVAVREAFGRIRGRWVTVAVRPLRWLVAPAVVAVVLLWAHQQARFDLLA